MKDKRMNYTKNEIPDEDSKVSVNLSLSEATWEKLERKATLRHVGTNELAADFIEKGLRKRSARDPEKLQTMIDLQQNFNELLEGIDQNELRENMINCMEGYIKLWQR